MIKQHINRAIFQPQTYAESCWAASFTNVFSQFPNETDKKTEADFLTQLGKRGNNASIQKTELENLLNNSIFSKYLTKLPNLFWKSITAIVDSGKILVHCFPIFESPNSHFVNIYGYEENKTGKWLYIYDPKPDKKGQHYVLSYSYFLQTMTQNTGTTRNQMAGIFYFKDTPPLNSSLDTQNFSLHDANVKTNSLLENLVSVANTLIEDSSAVSYEFLSIANVPLKGIERGSIKTLGKKPEENNILQPTSLRFAESQLSQTIKNFQILRSHLYKSNFLPLIHITNANVTPNEFKFITAITYRQNESGVESIFSLEFLNVPEIKNTLNTFLGLPNFGLSIYIENDNYRRLELTADNILPFTFQIDKKDFMSKPLSSLDQLLQQNTIQVSTPNDFVKVEQFKNPRRRK